MNEAPAPPDGVAPPPAARMRSMHVSSPKYAPRTWEILAVAIRKKDARPWVSVTPQERRALYADSAFASRMRPPEDGEEGWCEVDGVRFVVRG